MFQQLEQFVLNLAHSIPLEVFAFIGTILEEIVSPIPSPLVLITAGGIALNQDYTIAMLFALAGVAAVGKTIGNLIFYVIADKAEDILTGRFGKFIGFSHEDIQKMGRFFSQSNRDYFVIALFRAIPVMPTLPISLLAGFVRINLRGYLISSFVGLYVRCISLLLLGYFGSENIPYYMSTLDKGESVFKLLIIGLGIVAFIYFRQNREKVMNVFSKRNSSTLNSQEK